MGKMKTFTFLLPFSFLCSSQATAAGLEPHQVFGLNMSTPITQNDLLPTLGQTWLKTETMMQLPDLQKKGIWTRAGVPLWEIYRAPSGEETILDPLYNVSGFNAQIRILQRCKDYGYNWLCPLIPGYPSKQSFYQDTFWNNLYYDQAHTQRVSGNQLLNVLDTYRIPDLYYYNPRLLFPMKGGAVNALDDSRRQIQSIVTKLNSIAKLDLGWTDYHQRIAYQLGNEPAGGEGTKLGSFGALRPGGSAGPGATIGGWDGLGSMYEKIFGNVGFGTKSDTFQCSLVAPAFSLVSHGEGFNDNFLGRRYPNVTGPYPGGGSPFSSPLMEVVSANKELTDKTWAGRVNRRSVHFRCPQIMWRDNETGAYYLNYDNSPNFFGPGLPNGSWESPSHYATRVRNTLAELVAFIRATPMGSVPSNLSVDVTEFYFTNECLRGGELTAFPVNGKVDLEVLREASLSSTSTSPKALDSKMASRWAYLRAIRNELLTNPVPYMNRLYWFQVEKEYVKNPTSLMKSELIDDAWYNTGLWNRTFTNALLSNVNYSPYHDFMLSANDLNAIFGQ